MNYTKETLKYFENKCLTIALAKEKDRITITGLSSLQGEELKKQVLEFADQNKPRILFELRMQSLETQKGDSPLLCPARCKRTGKCYGFTFDYKSGRASDCTPFFCEYKEKVWEKTKETYWKQRLHTNHPGHRTGGK